MTVMADRLRQLVRGLTLSLWLFVVLGIVVGLVLAPHAFSMATGQDATVAVIPIEGGIEGSSAADVVAQLSEARADPSIEAVVLLANSPGGSAAASETLYMEVARTAEQMPVVGYVDAMAASGAYYAIVPSDHINAKPSSQVGSIGVFVTTPVDPQPIDQVIASGPNKLSGGSERDWMHRVESLRNAFVGAVVEQRGDRLNVSAAEISEADLYIGGEALNNGLVDGIGSLQDSIQRAARAAGLGSYDVEVLRADGGSGNATTTFITRTNYLASDAPNKELVSPSRFVGQLGDDPAVPNIVMLPASVVAATGDAPTGEQPNASEPEDAANESTRVGQGVVG